jgi:hypothetical protein
MLLINIQLKIDYVSLSFENPYNCDVYVTCARTNFTIRNRMEPSKWKATEWILLLIQTGRLPFSYIRECLSNAFPIQ